MLPITVCIWLCLVSCFFEGVFSELPPWEKKREMEINQPCSLSMSLLPMKFFLALDFHSARCVKCYVWKYHYNITELSPVFQWKYRFSCCRSSSLITESLWVNSWRSSPLLNNILSLYSLSRYLFVSRVTVFFYAHLFDTMSRRNLGEFLGWQINYDKWVTESRRLWTEGRYSSGKRDGEKVCWNNEIS